MDGHPGGAPPPAREQRSPALSPRRAAPCYVPGGLKPRGSVNPLPALPVKTPRGSLQPGQHLGGHSDALLVRRQEATASSAARATHGQNPAGKSLLSVSLSSSPAGKTDPRCKPPSWGVGNGPGTLPRGEGAPAWGAQWCGARPSLLAVEGRGGGRHRRWPGSGTCATTPGAKPWKWPPKGLGLPTPNPSPFSSGVVHLLPSSLQYKRRP